RGRHASARQADDDHAGDDDLRGDSDDAQGQGRLPAGRARGAPDRRRHRARLHGHRIRAARTEAPGQEASTLRFATWTSRERAMSLHERLLAEGPLERLVGSVQGAKHGPALVVVTGIHGNEPAGVLAARRVFKRLCAERVALRGDFVVLAGNLAALRQNERCLSRDLNRGWTREKLAALPASPGRLVRITGTSPAPEHREQRALIDAIDAAMHAARGPVTFLDLHSTSAPGIPFAMVRNEPEQRAFAEQFPLPIIMGLLELVDHTLLEFMRRQGCVTLGIEAGQNDTESSVDHHEAVLWQALVS